MEGGYKASSPRRQELNVRDLSPNTSGRADGNRKDAVPPLTYWALDGPRTMRELPRIVAERRQGTETFRNGSAELKFNLQDFWCWSTSDLLSNMTRGILAEFLVATALGVPTSGAREPWASYDLQTPDGIKIEVKSCAYLQSWGQRKPSRISFSIPTTRSWDAETNEYGTERARQADAYVFALLRHQDKNTVNPLDVSQWEFFVVPTTVLNQRAPTQRTLSLGVVQDMAGGAVTFEELDSGLRKAFGHRLRAV